MPAARYWRLTAVETYDYGDLELSEIALYDGAARVDASATISSAVAPTSGALAALSDVDFGTTVRWAVNPFAIVWDFGSAQNVDKIGVAGPARGTFAHKFVLQHSTDAVAWVNLIFSQMGTKWVNSTTLDTKVAGQDEFARALSLLLNANGADGSQVITDSSAKARVVTAIGTAQISTAQSKFGGASLKLNGAGNYVRCAKSEDFEFGTDPFAIALQWRPSDVTNTQVILAYMNVAATINNDIGFFLVYNPSAAIVQFVLVSGLSEISIVSSVLIPADQFTHIEIDRDGNNFHLFIGGAAAGTATSALGMNAPPSAELLIGRRFNSSPLPANGWIDDLQIVKGQFLHNAAFVAPAAEATLPPFDPTPLRTRQSAPSEAIIEAPVLPFDSYSYRTPQGYYDREDGGNFRIVGTVKEVALPTNTPLSRRVRLSYQDNGRVIREVFSDAAGNYVFDHIRGDRVYVVTAFDYAQIYRPVAADQLIAEAYP